MAFDPEAGYRLAMALTSERTTLYDVLASPAPQEAPVGETTITHAKETLDNDVEAFDFEETNTHGIRASNH